MEEYMSEEERKMKYMVDMYEMIDSGEAHKQEKALLIGLKIKNLAKLSNISVFEDPDLLEIVNLEISDVLNLIYASPVVLNPKDEFIEAFEELVEQLTDEVKSVFLTKEAFKDFTLTGIKRINDHTKAMGLVQMQLGAEMKVLSSALGKITKGYIDDMRRKAEEGEDE